MVSFQPKNRHWKPEAAKKKVERTLHNRAKQGRWSTKSFTLFETYMRH